jgi:hypothetical protein
VLGNYDKEKKVVAYVGWFIQCWSMERTLAVSLRGSSIGGVGGCAAQAVFEKSSTPELGLTF